MREEHKKLLERLQKMPKETEWLEFKEAKTQFDCNKFGKYFSAMSNEARLRGQERGFIVLGVEDSNKHEVVGTDWKRDGHESLSHLISENSTGGITFTKIIEVITEAGRVLIFEVPPAPIGMPIAWKGHYYGRNGESLAALSVDEMDRIRGSLNDWSAEICSDAVIDDLDLQALKSARAEFIKKYPDLKNETESWDDKTLLNKAKLSIKGKLTKTAILLLGKSESTHFISPLVARMTWVVKNEKGIELDYDHFDTPFILASQKLRDRIRNLKYRYMPDQTLFPEELLKYDTWVLREALHNCIAHQDYSLRGKIVVVEKPDELIFSNMGSFLPGNIENVIEEDAPPKQYRNPFLVQAMANLNMIDTIGSGIKRMYARQRERFFPMPTYELKVNEVTVNILGKILNPAYTNLLRRTADIDLNSIILLDYVQKGIRISKDAHKVLKQKKLVEGRYPNLYLSADVHEVLNKKTEYVNKRGLDTGFYENLVIEYLKKFKRASRKEIDDLLIGKMPGILDHHQKRNKVRNLIYSMSRRKGIIINKGSIKKPEWVLSK